MPSGPSRSDSGGAVDSAGEDFPQLLIVAVRWEVVNTESSWGDEIMQIFQRLLLISFQFRS